MRALEHYQRVLKFAEEVGNKSGMAGTLNSIGALYHDAGQLCASPRILQRSRKIKEEVGDKLGVARALNNMGMIHSVHGSVRPGTRLP